MSRSSQEHERIEEMLAAQALGGLSSRELAELDELRLEHGLDCAECLELESAYGEVAGRLAFALEPAAVPKGAADRVLRRAGAGRRDEGDVVRLPSRDSGWRWSRALVGAAAAVVLLVGGALGGYLVGKPDSGAADSQALTRLIAEPGTRVVEFRGTTRGTLHVAFNPADEAAYVFGSELPPLPAGRVYELWAFRGRNPAPSGTFETDGGVVIVPVSADVSRASMMAVTIERAPGVKKPTKPPILTAEIAKA